jgi:hypothetical protein
MPDARCTRSLACENKKHTSVVTTGPDGFNRHSLRNGFNGLLRDLPGDRAFLSPSLAKNFCKLDAGVEASGPHDFAVRFGVVRLSTLSRPPRPAPNVRDDGETPLLWARDTNDSAGDLGARSIARTAADWHDGQITAAIAVRVTRWMSSRLRQNRGRDHNEAEARDVYSNILSCVYCCTGTRAGSIRGDLESENQGHALASDSDGSHDKSDPQQDGTSPAKRPSVEVEKKIDPSVHREENENQAAITNQALVDRINRSDRWMIGLTAVIAAGGIISAVIFGRQLTVMQGQLDAMERDQMPYIWITDNLKLPEFRPNTGTTKGQVVWSWEFTNFGNGRAVEITIEHFIRLGPDGVFKRAFMTTGPVYGGDIPKGKLNFLTTVSEPIEKADFDQLQAVDFGISVLIEMNYSGIAGKNVESSVCLAKLATGAVAMPDHKDCKKSKEK